MERADDVDLSGETVDVGGVGSSLLQPLQNTSHLICQR